MLIIEDEFIGYGVSGSANNVFAARDEIEHDFDAVLLGLGLGGQHSPEIADLLIEMKVPLAFLTGYTRPFEPRHFQVPILLKSFTLAGYATFCMLLWVDHNANTTPAPP